MDIKLDDGGRLNALLREMSNSAKHAITLEKLLEDWTELVGAVERGYSLTLDDYRNDLDSRVLIQKLLESVSKPSRAGIEAILGPFDKRFKAATRPAPFLSTDSRMPWLSRVPKVTVAELREDIAQLKSVRGQWSSDKEPSGQN